MAQMTLSDTSFDLQMEMSRSYFVVMRIENGLMAAPSFNLTEVQQKKKLLKDFGIVTINICRFVARFYYLAIL
ncbi:MAG: hypothetical protein RIS47_1581 [Bacteroidota bacterium]